MLDIAIFENEHP